MNISLIKRKVKALYERMPLMKRPKFFYEQESLGISRKEIQRLKGRTIKFNSTTLFDKNIKIADNFWYLHSLKELFIDEVYRFSSQNQKPYIIDCGANIGLSTIYFKRLFPNASIVAFEPDTQNFEIIKYNLAQFGIEDVDVRNEAVWKEETDLIFSATGNVGGKLDFTSKVENSNQHIKTHAVRLRDLLNKKVDFLKIDIEGSEFEVLNDCKDMLHNVENLFVEYHSEPKEEQKIDNLLAILKSAGFRIYMEDAWINLPHPFSRNNVNPCFDMQLNISAYRIK